MALSPEVEEVLKAKGAASVRALVNEAMRRGERWIDLSPDFPAIYRGDLENWLADHRTAHRTVVVRTVVIAIVVLTLVAVLTIALLDQFSQSH